MLDSFTDSALAQLIKYCDVEIEKHRHKLEEAVGIANMNKSLIVLGGIQELRHILAMASGILRERAKGQS